MNLPLGARLWIADAPKDPKGMILICPGGGYQWLSPREAQPVAHAFTAAGWAAAVVYYTIREKPGQPPLGTLPVRQLGEALQTMQQRFPALSALVCGFSAGGHLAASLGVHWRELGLPPPRRHDPGLPGDHRRKVRPPRQYPKSGRFGRSGLVFAGNAGHGRYAACLLLAYRHRPGSAGAEQPASGRCTERGRCALRNASLPRGCTV